MLGGDAYQAVDVHHAGIVQGRAFHAALQSASDIDRHESPYIGAGGVGDKGFESTKCPGARTALVDDGCGARLDARSVRRHAEIRHPLVDVDVHVNEARRDDRPANIDRASGREFLSRSTDGDDTTVAYRHVGDSIAIVCRIDEAATP